MPSVEVTRSNKDTDEAPKRNPAPLPRVAQLQKRKMSSEHKIPEKKTKPLPEVVTAP